MALAFVAGRALGNEADSWTQWFVRAGWIVVAYLVVLSAYETWRALAHGDALLRLDDPRPHAGGWLSGTVEMTKPPRHNISLHVECVQAAMDVDRSKNIRTVVWQEIVILDPERIGEAGNRNGIPFAVWIPAEARPTATAETTDIEWNLRIEAGSYAQQFEVCIHPADSSTPAPRPSNPPRVTPAMEAGRLAQLTLAGSRATIDLPFPFVSFSLAILFLGIAVSIPFAARASSSDMGGAVVVTAGFLALFAFMLLVVALTPRRVEIEGDELRIARGVLGLGFHSRLRRSDVVKVEEKAPVDATATAFYGVHLRTRDGGVHVAATRLKDPARAKGVAAAIQAALQV
jgi:hypothetical protein